MKQSIIIFLFFFYYNNGFLYHNNCQGFTIITTSTTKQQQRPVKTTSFIVVHSDNKNNDVQKQQQQQTIKTTTKTILMAGQAQPEVETKTKVTTTTKQTVKQKQKQEVQIHDPISKRKEEFQDAPMYKLVLLGDDSYDTEHVITRMCSIMEDMDEDQAKTVLEQAQMAGKAMCGIYPFERAELFKEQLLRSDPMIFADLEEEK